MPNSISPKWLRPRTSDLEMPTQYFRSHAFILINVNVSKGFPLTDTPADYSPDSQYWAPPTVDLASLIYDRRGRHHWSSHHSIYMEAEIYYAENSSMKRFCVIDRNEYRINCNCQPPFSMSSHVPHHYIDKLNSDHVFQRYIRTTRVLDVDFSPWCIRKMCPLQRNRWRRSVLWIGRIAWLMTIFQDQEHQASNNTYSVNFHLSQKLKGTNSGE